jgi:hypothetical protein
VCVVLPREADAAEDLDRLIADSGQPTRERLDPQRGEPPFAIIGVVGGPQCVHHAAGGEFDRLVHVDAQVSDGLEASDGCSELLAYLGVFDGHLK